MALHGGVPIGNRKSHFGILRLSWDTVLTPICDITADGRLKLT
jgi:hypothetical protein